MNAIIAAKKAISLRACIVISEVPGKEVCEIEQVILDGLSNGEIWIPCDIIGTQAFTAYTVLGLTRTPGTCHLTLNH